MPLPDTIGLKAGTPKVWAPAGGDHLFTITSLANGAAWQGVKGDLGANWARMYNVHVETAVATAAIDGNPVEFFWCSSTSATANLANPGGLSGADATVANIAAVKRQLTYIGSLWLGNALGTVVQQQRFPFFPATRYGFPVAVNGSGGVALSATAANHKFTITPAMDEVIE